MADEDRRKSGRKGGRRKTDIPEAVIIPTVDAGPVGRGVVAQKTRGEPVVPAAAVAVAHEEAHGGHASVGFYWIIGGVLAVITALEVAVFYIPAMAPVLTPVLLILSAAKFALVVMFFMHLRFDSSVLTGLFGAGLLLATLLIIGLVILYHYLPSLEQ